MRLIEALRYSPPDCLAFVGAGGKSSALFQAARELVELTGESSRLITPNVIVTTTTHLGAWQADLADHSFMVNSLDEIKSVTQELPGGVVLITGEENNQRLGGLQGEMLDELQRWSAKRQLPLLIEADGARGRPLKAPGGHEPAIPEFASQVVVMAGMSGVDRLLSDDTAHRSEIFADLASIRPGGSITSAAVVKVLLSDCGGLKNIPRTARRQVLINQADTPELQIQAQAIAEQLIPAYEAGIIASLSTKQGQVARENNRAPRSGIEIYKVVEPIAAIILAAGGSSRFGQAKQVLPWRGQPLIRHVALTALQAGLSPVVAVLGANADEVHPAINNLPLRIVNNPKWDEGISTSIKAGLDFLPATMGGAVFLQADQPHIPATLIRSLVDAHQAGLQSIVAPQVDGQRGNPVLFDRRTFARLLELQGDRGGRALFSQYPIEWVSWPDQDILLDIDTVEDYQNFLELHPPEVQA